MQGPALGEELGTSGTVDRAVDTAASEQGRVGGIDDRVGFGVGGDVALQCSVI